MEKILTKSVIGQPQAVKAVANAIRLSRSGLSNQDRPIASFLCTFLVPSTLQFGPDALSVALSAPRELERRSSPRLSRRFSSILPMR